MDLMKAISVRKKLVHTISLRAHGQDTVFLNPGFATEMMIVLINKMNKIVHQLLVCHHNSNVQIFGSVSKKVTNVMEYRIAMITVMNWDVVSEICAQFINIFIKLLGGYIGSFLSCS